MRYAATAVRCVLGVLVVTGGTSPAFAQSLNARAKIGPLAQTRIAAAGRSQVIIRIADSASPAAVGSLVQQLGGTLRRTLPIINAHVAELPNATR